MRNATILTAAMVLAGVLTAWGEEKAAPQPPAPTRHVDLVICLDTSGSMSGLIESAKQKLWAVVNELATAKPKPVLRVALYQYGNDGIPKDTGWVEKLCDLTDDLDSVYGKLFPLRTNGGTEYVARVVKRATEDLQWNMDKGTLRLIFVAGNEPATQDEATNKLQDVCKAAAGKGIVVNTIHCGSEAEGRNSGWADAATWADGKYAAIDQDSGTVVVATPYDKKIAELGVELNKTYAAYGPGGAPGAANQAAQDANAVSAGAPAAADRAKAKSSGLYSNAGWDLVDAVEAKRVDLEKVDAKDLPEDMRKMSLEERKAHLAAMKDRRAAVQDEVRKLSALRDEHVKAEMAKNGLSDKAAFDSALRGAVRDQAEKAGFAFENK